MARTKPQRLRNALRKATPPWLRQKLLPFESELERLAKAFCCCRATARLIDLAAGAAPCGPRAIAIDKDVESLRVRRGLRVCADAHQLPLRHESVDAICCSAALHHFEDPQRALCQMSNSLRAGGELFLSVPYLFPQTVQNDDYHRFDRAALVNLLQATGWSVESCAPIGGRYWVFSRVSLELLFDWFRGSLAPLFLFSAPILGFSIPLCCFYLDRYDRKKDRTLGWAVTARKKV